MMRMFTLLILLVPASASAYTLVGTSVTIPNPISVKQFGATGDGITNDTPAIQSAINLAGRSSVSSGVVFIPAGVYISTGYTIPDNVEIVGQGSKVVTLKFAVASSSAIVLNSALNVKIRKLKLYNVSPNNTAMAIGGNTIREFTFDEYEVEGFYNGINLEEPVNCVIGQGRWIGINVGSGTCVQIGSVLAGVSATATDVRDAYCSTYSTGVYVGAGNTNRIRSIFENTQKPIVTNTHAGTNARTYVYGAHFESNAANAILMTALGNSEILADGVIASEGGGYITDWGPRVSGKVSVFATDQVFLSTATKFQLGTSVASNIGDITLQNSKFIDFVNPKGDATMNALSIDVSSFTTLNANSWPLRVQNSSVTVTNAGGIGVNGAAAAVTANPAGYLFFSIGGVRKQIPYYNTNP